MLYINFIIYYSNVIDCKSNYKRNRIVTKRGEK